MAEDVLGPRPPLRDRRLLRQAALRPMLVVFGEEVFPTLMEKAAALLEAVAAYHPLYDGNKRLATLATARFLTDNGLHPIWGEDEMVRFVLDVARKELDVAQIAVWLAANTQPRS